MKTSIRLIVIFSVFILIAHPVLGQKSKKDKKQDKTVTNNTSLAPEYMDGLRYSALQETDQAISSFNACLDKNPDFAPAHYELAEIYLVKNDRDKCLYHAEYATKLDPTNKWYLQLYAESNAVMNKFDVAAIAYKKLLEQNPYDYSIYYDYAYALKASGNWNEAIKALNILEQKTGLDESLSIEKQKMYIQLNDVDAAAKEIQNLIDAYPQETKYYNLLADIYMAAGKKEQADGVYKRLQALDPNNPYSLLSQADSYLQQGNQNGYFESLKKAFAHPDLDVETKIQILIQQYNYANGFSEKDVEPALILAELMAKSQPDEAPAQSVYADLLYRANKKNEAIEYYHKAIDKYPNNQPVWEQLFFIESELNNMDMLAKDTKSFIELFPNEPIGYYFNGSANIRMGKYDDAIKSLKKAALIGADNKNLMAEIYSQIAEAYHQKKEYTLMDQNFDKALNIDPTNIVILNNYGYYLSLRGDRLDDAASMSKQTLEIEPNNPSYLDTYGWILFKQGKLLEAQKNIQLAIENGGANSDAILDHYGDVLKSLNKNSEALEYWKKAIELGGDSNEINKKINSTIP